MEKIYIDCQKCDTIWYYNVYCDTVCLSLTDYSIILLIKAGNLSGTHSYQSLVHSTFGFVGYLILSVLQFLYPFIGNYFPFMISYRQNVMYEGPCTLNLYLVCTISGCFIRYIYPGTLCRHSFIDCMPSILFHLEHFVLLIHETLFSVRGWSATQDMLVYGVPLVVPFN